MGTLQVLYRFCLCRPQRFLSGMRSFWIAATLRMGTGLPDPAVGIWSTLDYRLSTAAVLPEYPWSNPGVHLEYPGVPLECPGNTA